MQAAVDEGAAMRRGPGYQILLVALLSANFGILYFDRSAIQVLMPSVQPDLQLTNTQVGLVFASLSLTWAVVGFFVGGLSDRLGSRKPILILSTIAYAACSVMTGFASSFAFLIASRLLMGAADGGVYPISQAMAAAEISPKRRGLAMGVIQNFSANLLGAAIGPIVLVTIAGLYGWRNAFFLAAIPGFVSALLMWIFLREPPRAPRPTAAGQDRISFRQAFAKRNILLCTLIGALVIAYVAIFFGFLPLYLTKVRGYSLQTMGLLMSGTGVAVAILGTLVPAISDRIGRRPVMIVVPLFGLILPIAALYYQGPLLGLGLLFAAGTLIFGLFSLFLAIVPSETVEVRYLATTLGMLLGVAEFSGSVVGPALAGMAADAWGLQAPLWILAGISIPVSLLALGIQETAPRVLARRAG